MNYSLLAPGSVIEGNDGQQWFRGDLGWYSMPIDPEDWPVDEVPGGGRAGSGVGRRLHVLRTAVVTSPAPTDQPGADQVHVTIGAPDETRVTVVTVCWLPPSLHPHAGPCHSARPDA